MININSMTKPKTKRLLEGKILFSIFDFGYRIYFPGTQNVSQLARICNRVICHKNKGNTIPRERALLLQ